MRDGVGAGTRSRPASPGSRGACADQRRRNGGRRRIARPTRGAEPSRDRSRPLGRRSPPPGGKLPNAAAAAHSCCRPRSRSRPRRSDVGGQRVGRPAAFTEPVSDRLDPLGEPFDDGFALVGLSMDQLGERRPGGPGMLGEQRLGLIEPPRGAVEVAGHEPTAGGEQGEVGQVGRVAGRPTDVEARVASAAASTSKFIDDSRIARSARSVTRNPTSPAARNRRSARRTARSASMTCLAVTAGMRGCGWRQLPTTLDRAPRPARRPVVDAARPVVRPGLREQDSEVRVRSRSGDQIAGVLEQIDCSLIRRRGGGQVAEAMENEPRCISMKPELVPTSAAAIEQRERAGRVAEVEHHHRQGATDVAERSAVERRSVLHAALEIGPRS